MLFCKIYVKRFNHCYSWNARILFLWSFCCKITCQTDQAVGLADCFLWCAVFGLGSQKNLTDKIPFFSKRACPFYNYYTTVFPVTHAIFGIFPQRKPRQGEREANICRPWNSCCLPCDLLSWDRWEFHCCFCASSQHSSSSQFIATNLTNVNVMRYTGIGEIWTRSLF